VSSTSDAKHRRRGDLLFFFTIRPRPTRHVSAQLRSQRSAPRAPSALSTPCRSRPPRSVTVFAEREDQPGASTPQKQRPPLPTLPSPVGSFVALARSPTHAPSRRLQRVSFVCTHALRGQASRRRPGPATSRCQLHQS
jgi:hypothetical protein